MVVTKRERQKYLNEISNMKFQPLNNECVHLYF